jgi:hypothetical protein
VQLRKQTITQMTQALKQWMPTDQYQCTSAREGASQELFWNWIPFSKNIEWGCPAFCELPEWT